MPGLQSFCVTVAIGLASIYILQITWFTAWLSLDQRRIDAGKNGVIPCYTHKDHQPETYTNNSFQMKMKSGFSKLLDSSLYKAIVILIGMALFAIGIYGWIEIEQIFYPFLLMPSDSYLREWIRFHKEHYPDNGWDATLYSGHLGHQDLASVDQLVTQLEKLETEHQYLRGVDTWWSHFKEYTLEEHNKTWLSVANEQEFPTILSDFLYSSHGAKYKSSFKFAEDLVCNQQAPEILASKFTISYVTLTTPDQHIPATSAVKSAINEAGSPYNFSHVKIYASWETDIIIGSELWRNLGLSVTCVIVITFLLLCNIQICILVVLMVILSLTDIIGFLHFWDITIDIISCISIVLSVGLCVDYAVHIGHAYLVAHGNRRERTHEAITSIGPAVFNGGLTTFIALVLCSMSTGHVLLTFFKVFTLTVLFGLFHGLVLLPVLLSIMGPLSSTQEEERTIDMSNNKLVDNGSHRISSTKKGKINDTFEQEGVVSKDIDSTISI